MKDLDEEGYCVSPRAGSLSVHAMYVHICMYCMDGGVLDLALMQPLDIDP